VSAAGDRLAPKTAAGRVTIMPPKTACFARSNGPVQSQVHGVAPWGFTGVDPGDDPKNR
jgi:hypothetical protein